MPEPVKSIASLLHRIARLSMPATDLTLGLDRDNDAIRSSLEAVRAGLPAVDCTDDEILCLSCFYSKSENTERLLTPRVVAREMERRGYDHANTQHLIGKLREKGLLEIPQLLQPPEGDDEMHTVFSGPGHRERLRVKPAVAVLLRQPPGATIVGYASIREHLNACLAVAAMLHRAMKRSGREERVIDDDFVVISAKSRRPKIPDEIRLKKEEIALRETRTVKPLPLLQLVQRLRLDDMERDMLILVLYCALSEETCHVRHLEALLRVDPFESTPRPRYLSYTAPLFYCGILQSERDTPSAFQPRADVTIHPVIRDWLLTGEGDPLNGMGCCDDPEHPLPYTSNREQLVDWLRYIGARRRTVAPSRRGRWSDDDASPFLGMAQSDAKLRLRFLEIERGIEARCSASAGRFPLQNIVERCELSKPERDILLLLLERELCGQDTEVRDVITFFGADVFDALQYRRMLQAEAALLRNDLITVQFFHSFDRADVMLTQTAREELLGDDDGAEPPDRCKRLQLDQRSAFTVETVAQHLSDLVLPASIESTLRTAIARYHSNADALLASWGFAPADAPDSDLSQGAALRLLFSGAPGTGKTYAAGALANDLGRELLVTDISKLLSKWVGDSEKNVRGMFDEYERISSRLDAPPVLLLNECDQFLGRRGTTSEQSVDRMYHQMQNLFLERIERFAGILIATTNLVDSLDDAFSRRFHYKLVFPMPDAGARLAIWKKHIPSTMPLADDVDLGILSRDYPFSGGQISVVVRNAATAAAVRGSVACLADFLDACTAEQRGAFGERSITDTHVGFRVQA